MMKTFPNNKKSSKLGFSMHAVKTVPYSIIFMVFMGTIGFLHPVTTGVSEDSQYDFLANFCPFLWTANTWSILSYFFVLSVLSVMMSRCYTAWAEVKILSGRSSKKVWNVWTPKAQFLIAASVSFIMFTFYPAPYAVPYTAWTQLCESIRPYAAVVAVFSYLYAFLMAAPYVGKKMVNFILVDLRRKMR